LARISPAGVRDPAPQHPRKVEPVAIFESVHRRPRNFVEAHGGAGAVTGRPIGDRFHGQDAGPGVIHEWNTQPLAIRSTDEGEFRPASRTEPLPFDRPAHAAHSRGGVMFSVAANAGRTAPAARKSFRYSSTSKFPVIERLPFRWM
jgi:hypothetical protein